MQSKISSLKIGEWFLVIFVPLLFVSDFFLTGILQYEEVPFIYFNRGLLLLITSLIVLMSIGIYKIGGKFFSNNKYRVLLALAYSVVTTLYVNSFINSTAGIFFPKLIIESLIINIIACIVVTLGIVFAVKKLKIN
jgi:hypothetical protein